MARKRQDEFPETTDISTSDIWMNCQVSDAGNQQKINGSNMPFAAKTGASIWEWSNSTADSNQGTATCWFNNGTQSSTTIVYINKIDGLGDDWGARLLGASIGDQFTVSKEISNAHRFEVNGAVIDGTTYVKIPVTHISTTGDLKNGDDVKIQGYIDNATAASIQSATHKYLGWAHYIDTQYTSGSPLELRSGNGYSASLSIDGLGGGGGTGEWPTGVPEPWNTSTNKMISSHPKDLFTVRILLKAQDGAAVNFVDFGFDIGGSVGQFMKGSRPVSKGTSSETDIDFTSKVFSAADFVANGATITLSTNSIDMDIWDMSILISRDYVGI